MSIQEFVKPAVGDGVTLIYPQDRYPFVIVEVSPSGKTVKVQPVETVSRETGHEPARFDGPWPVWSHTYTAEELQELKRDTPTPDTLRYNSRSGRWTGRNGNWKVGEARYHRNYSY